MSDFDFDFSEFDRMTARHEGGTERALEEALDEVLDDLILFSSNIAPKRTGTLRKSHSREIKKRSNGNIVGDVAYSAIEESLRYGLFNYALWTHEKDYNPSMSGSFRGYHIGNKYLSRPLYGESDKWLGWFGEAVVRSVND